MNYVIQVPVMPREWDFEFKSFLLDMCPYFSHENSMLVMKIFIAS